MNLSSKNNESKKSYTPEELYEFRIKLSAWYQHNGRRFPWRKKSIGCYQKIVSEVLLQRTRAETVASFFPIFIKRFPSWKSLASATEDEIASFIKPIGLWQRRAGSLSRLANEMARRNGRFPRDRKKIEELPGVGQYIANAIQLFCHGRAMPLLDVNMSRVLERYFGPRQLVDIRYDPYLQDLASAIVKGGAPEFINWAILDLAAIVCKARIMDHDNCPLADACKYLRQPSNETK